MINLPPVKPQIPGQEKALDMLLLTPFDGVLIATATWLICMILFRIYRRASEGLLLSLKKQLMKTSIELLRLSKVFSACMPGVLPRQMYANQIVAADAIRRMRDDGIVVKGYDADEVLQQLADQQQTKS